MVAAKLEDTAEAWELAYDCQASDSEAEREAYARYTKLKGDSQ
jgi:hypothetical protein